MFRRRKARSWLQVTAAVFYPDGGWRRAGAYIVHRLRRLPDPPHRIARGVAAGVFVCFTPFYGFHFILAAVIALAIRGNVVAALLATFFGNPLTFPLIAVFAVEAGQWMLGTEEAGAAQDVLPAIKGALDDLWHNVLAVFTGETASWEGLGGFVRHIMWPYIVGGFGPGLAVSFGAYMLAVPAVTAYQRRRAAKLRKRYLDRKEKRRAAERSGGQAEGRGLGPNH